MSKDDHHHPWHSISPGQNLPEIVNAIIEIPKGSKAKYEIDKESNLIKLDRVLFSSVMYPANYGFIPQTYCDDNDPLDILVLCSVDVYPMTIIEAKVIGVMHMVDNGEQDDKIIAVAKNDQSVNYINDLQELPPHTMKEIVKFFQDYKALEEKKVTIEHLLGVRYAHKVINESIELYDKTFRNKLQMSLFSICMSTILFVNGYLPVSVLTVVKPEIADTDSIGWRILFALFLVFLNGFFVAAEFAIVKVRASQVEIKAKSGSRIGKMAKNIVHNLDGYLAATQLGITLASLGLGWVGEDVMYTIFQNMFNSFDLDFSDAFIHSASTIVAFSLITIMHIVFGELAPKSLAIQRPVATTMFVAVPLQIFYVVFRPFIWALNSLAAIILKPFGINTAGGHDSLHSNEELQYLLDQGKESGALEDNEHELIKNVFDFNERVVKNIMVPRTKIMGIELKSAKDEVVNKIIAEGYSRMPVYDDIIDKIIGIVHAKDVLPLLAGNKDWTLGDIIRKPFFIPETKKINDLLNELQQKRIQIAIVLDEFGGTAGMVTLEDIVEEIVGEIQDEYDEEHPTVERISDTEFVVNGYATVYDVNEHLPHDLPEDEDFDTVGGLVSHAFGKIPEVGDSEECYGYLFTILRKTEQNIETIKLELVINRGDMVDAR